MVESRPILSEPMSGQELLRCYWLRDELAGFARTLGVPTTVGKQALTARLVAHLEGQPPPPVLPAPPPPAPALPEPLTATTVIPVGQRCTQQVRRYFTDDIGAGVRLDAHMSDFITTGVGQTLGAAVAQGDATRARPAPEIGDQFELNAFMRRRHRQHPDDLALRPSRPGAPTAGSLRTHATRSSEGPGDAVSQAKQTGSPTAVHGGRSSCEHPPPRPC